MTPLRSSLGLAALLSAVALSVSTVGQDRQAAAEAIGRIERALQPPVIITGRAPVVRTLADRMRELKVPGVSAAVFRNGRIEWTKGWGAADRRVGTAGRAGDAFPGGIDQQAGRRRSAAGAGLSRAARRSTSRSTLPHVLEAAG